MWSLSAWQEPVYLQSCACSHVFTFSELHLMARSKSGVPMVCYMIVLT
jgi:hypothetical protein